MSFKSGLPYSHTLCLQWLTLPVGSISWYFQSPRRFDLILRSTALKLQISTQWTMLFQTWKRRVTSFHFFCFICIYILCKLNTRSYIIKSTMKLKIIAWYCLFSDHAHLRVRNPLTERLKVTHIVYVPCNPHLSRHCCSTMNFWFANMFPIWNQTNPECVIFYCEDSRNYDNYECRPRGSYAQLHHLNAICLLKRKVEI